MSTSKYLELNETNDVVLFGSFEELVDAYGDTESVIETYVEEESCTLWEIIEAKEVFSINADVLQAVDLVSELFDELFGERKDPGEVEVLCEAYDIENGDVDDDDSWMDDDEDDCEDDDEDCEDEDD